MYYGTLSRCCCREAKQNGVCPALQIMLCFSDLETLNIEAAHKAKLAEIQDVHFYGSGIEQGTTFSTSMDQVYSRGHIFKLLWIRYRAGDNFLNCHGSGIKLETTL